MLIGLIIFGIVAIMIFFGAAERYFSLIGITSWLSFVIILAFVLGSLVPDIQVGDVIVSVSGIIVPVVTAIVLMVAYRSLWNMGQVVISGLLIALLVTGIKVMFLMYAVDLIVLYAFAVGIVSGLVSLLITADRVGILVDTMCGIIIGDIVASAILYTSGANITLAFGTYGTFDSIAIAGAVGLILYELTEYIKSINLNKKARMNKQLEIADDMNIDVSSSDVDERMVDMPDDKKEKERENLLKYLDKE